MADVQHLLHEFIAADRAGEEPDPLAFLDGLQGVDRAELEALLEAYLSRAPRRRFDAAAYAHSPARPVAEGLERTLMGAAGLWPSLLPRLRHRARLKRSELVARLAASLGAPERQDKVGGYYHRMEQGTLPAEGVSDRVLDALAGILGESARALREAGRTLGSPGGPAAGRSAVFARVAAPDPAFPEDGEPVGGAGRAPSARDDIDELFTGRNQP